MKKQLDLFRGRNIAGTLIAAALLLPVAETNVRATLQVQATPISITSSSWNADVVYASESPTDTAVGFDGTHAWDAYGINYGPNGTNEYTDESGLPAITSDPGAAVVFTSRATDALNSSKTTFQFQSFLGNNCLWFNSYSPSNGLTLTTPKAYDNLAILSASANAAPPGATLSMTLTLADGTTTVLSPFTVYDWSINVGNAIQMALPNAVDRSAGSSGTEKTSFSPDAPLLNGEGSQYYQMYETDFNLASYSNKAITSVSFSAPSSGDVGIFALSGYANPTQPPLVKLAPPDSPVPLPASLPLTFFGGTLLALAAIGRRIRRSL